MQRIGRILLIGLGVVIGAPLLLVTILAIVSRFADGPLVELLPGGSLTSGEWVETEPADWSFVTNESIVELESDGRSRKTWILTIDGKAYIPASLGFPPFKTWHRRALEVPEAVVRIAGKRYARRLHKVEDRGLASQLAQQVRVKYGAVPAEDSGAWFFRLDPPL
jgi:hypothetical protein